mmetsp:Transcript_28193/g.66958  ORF Transcript_28193/g.66958 Transcript_28193/m.66958 type:complete len:340 (-) Transcript_28193:152-1171(-)
MVAVHELSLPPRVLARDAPVLRDASPRAVLWRRDRPRDVRLEQLVEGQLPLVAHSLARRWLGRPRDLACLPLGIGCALGLCGRRRAQMHAGAGSLRPGDVRERSRGGVAHPRGRSPGGAADPLGDALPGREGPLRGAALGLAGRRLGAGPWWLEEGAAPQPRGRRRCGRPAGGCGWGRPGPALGALGLRGGHGSAGALPRPGPAGRPLGAEGDGAPERLRGGLPARLDGEARPNLPPQVRLLRVRAPRSSAPMRGHAAVCPGRLRFTLPPPGERRLRCRASRAAGALPAEVGRGSRASRGGGGCGGTRVCRAALLLLLLPLSLPLTVHLSARLPPNQPR